MIYGYYGDLRYGKSILGFIIMQNPQIICQIRGFHSLDEDGVCYICNEKLGVMNIT